jgi:SMODS and SLOG-associating 2TM effector domain 3/SMODS and SLOG-associating 2TM effector domain 1
MYLAADGASRRSQNLHFASFALEFVTLILVAVVNTRFHEHEWRPALLVLALIAFAAVAVGRRLKEWERKWYQSRALAESVKTTAWRYAMKAEPFDKSVSDQEAGKRFREYLAGILRANRQLGTVISSNDVADDQITEDMRAIRRLNVNERIALYTSSRVDNQQDWYSKKSKRNSKIRNAWSLGISVIFFALILSVFRDDVAPRILSSYVPR